MGPLILGLPAIEMGLAEAPKIIGYGLEIINGLKHLFHHGPDLKLTPVQVDTVRAMSLAGMRAKLLAEAPDISGKLTDQQVSLFMEMIYQSQKTIPVAVASDPALSIPDQTGLSIPDRPVVSNPVGNDSMAILIGRAILALLKALTH